MYRTIRAAFMLFALGIGACSTGRREPGTVRPDLGYAATLGAGETLRLELADGARYRLEVEGRGARVELVPLEPGMMRPLLSPFFPGTSLSRVKVYDFEVRASGLYQLRVLDAGDGALPVRVRMEQARYGSRRTVY